MSRTNRTDRALRNLEVSFEEIRSVPSDKKRNAKPLDFDISEIHFLPVVVADEAEIEGYSLSDFEVSFEQKNEPSTSENEVNISFDLEDGSIIDAQNPPLDDMMSSLKADNQLREIECSYQKVPYLSDYEMADDLIPEPVYNDKREAYMMGLLDDLEELGDHREIPFLEELRAVESKSFIKDRIAGMIEKFARQRNAKKTKKADTQNQAGELPVFSVFADLFNTIDAECKLILLDEIIHVGDDKEIGFLDGLLGDSDRKIRDKAGAVLKQLIAKLSLENPSGTYSQGVSAIAAEKIKSDDDFGRQLYDGLLFEMDIVPFDARPEPSEVQIEPDEKEVAPGETDFAPDGAGKLFDIGFELSEALDRYNRNIMDLPVVATEVSANGDGGSSEGLTYPLKS